MVFGSVSTVTTATSPIVMSGVLQVGEGREGGLWGGGTLSNLSFLLLLVLLDKVVAGVAHVRHL